MAETKVVYRLDDTHNICFRCAVKICTTDNPDIEVHIESASWDHCKCTICGKSINDTINI